MIKHQLQKFQLFCLLYEIPMKISIIQYLKMYQLHTDNEMMKMPNQNMLYTYLQLPNTKYKLDTDAIDIYLVGLDY